MDAKDRDAENLLQKLWTLAGCNEEQTCTCPIHVLLKRTLDNYREEREREVREGAERQAKIEQQKLSEDFE